MEASLAGGPGWFLTLALSGICHSGWQGDGLGHVGL